MKNPVGKAERELIWAVMSEFFVGNEIDYDREAARISRFPMNVPKEIFFREVAPVCGSDMLLTPTPAVGAAFDSDWVVSRINSLLLAKENSLVCRISYEANALYYRFRLADLGINLRNDKSRLTEKRSSEDVPGRPDDKTAAVDERAVLVPTRDVDAQRKGDRAGWSPS